MHKLIFSEGGQPISLDDLEFLQSAVSQGLDSLASQLPNGVFFDFGTYTPTEGAPKKLTWKDGFAIIGGKTAFIAEGTMTLEDEVSKYCVRRIEQATANKPFADSSTHPTQLLEQAEIVLRSSLSENEPHLPLAEDLESPKLMATTYLGRARIYHRGQLLGFLRAYRSQQGFNLIRGDFRFYTDLLTDPEGCTIAVSKGKGNWFNGGGFLSGDNLPLGVSFQALDGKFALSGDKDGTHYPEGNTQVSIAYLTHSIL